MINKIVHSIAKPHHTWRKVKFDELAEIYASMSLRTFGLGIIGIFVPIYLYNLGFSVQEIFLFFSAFFVLRIPVAFISAFIIARIGPKHTIAMSTIILISFLISLVSYSELQWPLIFMALLFTLANGMFFIAYNVDFSKINHSEHGGKELGWLFIFERAGAAAGPVIGGLVASIFAPELSIVLSILVLIGSLVPLFLSNEPVKIHQKITFKNFPLRQHVRDFISQGAFNVQIVNNAVVWPLFLAVIIFSGDVYAKLGALIGVTMVISMFSAIMFGKFIDNKKGGSLLTYGTIMNVVMNFSRSIVTSVGGAIGVSTLSEPTALSYRMPITKGFLDVADSIEGYRIVYTTWNEVFVASFKGAFCLIIYFLGFYTEPEKVFRSIFIFAAAIGLLMLIQKFPSLRKV